MNYKIYPIICSIFIISCKDNKNTSSDNYIDFNSIVENDTLSLNEIPKNLNSWLRFYKRMDTLFTLSNFKASGVVLHTSALNEADTLRSAQLKLKSLFEYSKSGSCYIDLWSYGSQIMPDKVWASSLELAKYLKDGEVDQQVVLGMRDGKRYELMFNGPATISDFAEWLNDDQFLISHITKDSTLYIVELFVFDIKEKIFTNYRLNHTPAFDLETESYVEYWIKETDKLIK